MFEAGLDPDLLANNTQLVAEGLILYNVIDRCRLQLEDMKSGTLYIHQFFLNHLLMHGNSFQVGVLYLSVLLSIYLVVVESNGLWTLNQKFQKIHISRGEMS